jgi:hypothetical protein
VEAAPSLSPRLTRALFWVGLAVLAAGTIFFVVKVFGGGDDTSTTAVRTPVNLRPPAQNDSAQPRNTLRNTDIGKEARSVAGKFILTAVARKRLGESWKYIHPDLRAGYTLRQWKTGENPIVPFPVAALDQARFRILWRQANAMQLQVALIPKKKGDVPATIFDLGLRKVGTGERARWLVDYWMPNFTPPIQDVPSR